LTCWSGESAKRNRDEFWQLISGLLSLAAVCLAAFVVLAELLAPQITWLFGARNFDDPALWPIATDLLRVMLPAVLFLNLAGLLTGALYSLKRFTLPALTAAAFNACVVMAALLRPDRIDSLAWGVLAGSIIQVMLQLPRLELRRLRHNAHPVPTGTDSDGGINCNPSHARPGGSGTEALQDHTRPGAEIGHRPHYSGNSRPVCAGAPDRHARL
jgi:peptidoglycan biosynthesis protein MviN/MurJ (putative lipid II flippase)